MIRNVCLLAISVLSSMFVIAQEETKTESEIEFDIGADIVSSYVWRGIQHDATPNIQGWGEMSSDVFFAGLWASTNFGDSYLDSIAITEEPYFSNNSNYSTYFELMYPISLGNIDFEFSLGGVTHESYFYDASKAAIINIGIKASKILTISEKFNLPVYDQLTINPELESVYSLFSLSF